MYKALQINIHKSFITLFFLSFSVLCTYAQNDSINRNEFGDFELLEQQKDSLVAQDELNLIAPVDSIQNDSLNKPKGAIEYIITHNATGYIKENFSKSLTILYDEAEIDYGDVNIKSGHILIDHANNIIVAKGIKDSLGYTQRPVVVQGGQESTHDSIMMNYKTERLVAYGTNAVLSEFDTRTTVTKKLNDSTIYIRDVILTTSQKNPPDYHIAVTKGKLVPDSKIVAGTSQMYIAEVPTPIVLPFAYFPLTEGRSSGLIMPSYGTSRDQGFFLQNGGYYLALSDYYDLAITGDIYTNGSWGLNLQSAYVKRYKFSGGFSIRYENLYRSIRGLEDFAQTSNYNIRWNHGQDSKANPNARFSASVNLGSSKYYRQSLNEYNSNSFLNNTLSSSISYQRTFVGTPFNMSASMTHSQNTNTESIIMSLPALALSMDRIYPFQPKNGPKKNAFHNLGVVYNLKGDYRFDTTDEEFFTQEMFDDARGGVQQDVGASTSVKMLKHLTLSPNGRYKEVWYFDRVEKEYNEEEDLVETDTIRGFNAYREYSIGAGLSTTIYGDFRFKGKIEAIRHTFRPSINYSYRPDFGYYYEEVQVSPDPEDTIEYSPYQNGIYGNPSKGISNSIGITLANVFEAKVKPKDSTETESRKVMLLNNLNLSSSYNIAADSLKWSPTSLTAGTSLLDNKMTVNLRAQLDPYALDVNGRRINKFNIDNGGSLFRLTNASFTMNYTLSNQTFEGKDDKGKGRGGSSSRNDPTSSDGIFGENMTATNEYSKGDEKEDSNVKAELYRSKTPWSIRFAYAFNYNNFSRQNEVSSHSLMFSGDIELTPKWKMGFSSGYDIKEQGFTYTQLRFNRDLDSWKMSFNWVPFGPRTTYNFYIGIKSGILSDVKYDQRQVPDRALF